jgi:hypothetical protein
VGIEAGAQERKLLRAESDPVITMIKFGKILRYGEPPPHELKSVFTEKDDKELARLVRKYRADRIATEMQRVPLRGPGRPRGGKEDIDVAYCIEAWAEEYRRAGSLHPQKEAWLELYELLHSREELQRIAKRDALEREKAKLSGKKAPQSPAERWWENRYKRKFSRGRKELRRQLEQAKAVRDHLRRLREQPK